MQRVIIHLDMNSYFATVTQQDNIDWRGLPLGVCEHLGGIIIAASVQAKKWGIKTGTPVWEAKKLYPKIILTKTNPTAYRLYIARVIKVVSDYTNFVEQASIDELYADITKVCNVRRHSEGVPACQHLSAAMAGRHPTEESQIRDPSAAAEAMADRSDALRMTPGIVDPFPAAGQCPGCR